MRKGKAIDTLSKYSKGTFTGFLVLLLVSCQNHPFSNTDCRYIVKFVCNDPRNETFKRQNPNYPFEREMMELFITGRAVNLGGSGSTLVNAIKNSNNDCARVAILSQIALEGEKSFDRKLAKDTCTGLKEFLDDEVRMVGARSSKGSTN